MSGAKKTESEAGESRFVEVDIVAFMNCIRPRGPKFSVNKKRLLNLVDAAVSKEQARSEQLKKENKQLREQIRKLKKTIDESAPEKQGPSKSPRAENSGAEEVPKKKRKSDQAPSTSSK
ncbi:hypothetical protein GCK32_019004 [Trichostrongylus colubriformis]|uniref:Uncharacterized protein n=1 Tax=Trichostrongylus colubriformis TaxID=6319 RepID=A0AAN8G400_TRICO